MDSNVSLEFVNVRNIHEIINVNIFVNIIYKNFNEKYSHKEIIDILTSQYLAGYIIFNNDIIIGYILGEIHIMTNTKFTYFPEFLFVNNSYRNNEIGTLLFKKIISYCKQIKIDNIIIDYENGEIIKSILTKLKFEIKQFNNIVEQPNIYFLKIDNN